jgi:hypothetical protein
MPNFVLSSRAFLSLRSGQTPGRGDPVSSYYFWIGNDNHNPVSPKNGTLDLYEALRQK